VSLIADGSIPSISAGLSLTVGSAVSLYAVLKDFLDVKPPENLSGAKDLAVLQEQIRNIGIDALEEEKKEDAEKLLDRIGNGSGNPTPDDSNTSDMIEKKARGALKQILNPPTKVALATKAGDEKIIELIKSFSADYLTKDSGMIEIFKDYTELRYFADVYPNRVRHRLQLLRGSIQSGAKRAIVRCFASLSESLLMFFCHASSNDPF
jgi:hypothetical protein